MITITQHAYDRAKERLSFNARTLNRLAEKAFSEGLTHSQTKGQLKKFVSKLYLQYGSANNIRIYGENIYLFCEQRLITLYQLPNNLRKHVKYSL